MSTHLSLSRHSGAILNTQKVAELIVTENAYAPQARLPKHSHSQACFCLVLQGAYTEVYSRKTLNCEPFSVVFRPAGEMHSDHFSSVRVRCFIIEFDNSWLERVHTYTAGLDGPRTFHHNSIVWLALKLRKEIKRMDAVTPLTIEGLMLEMMAEASRYDEGSRRDVPPPWLAQVREMLQEHSTERLTLSSLAETVGVHPVYLACAFRRHYGCTVGEYVRQLRVESACRELSKTNTPLSQIALTAGFADQSQFSRTFKRVIGLTPTEYRKTVRFDLNKKSALADD
jgi:AraC family transcriptional regulator